MKYAYLIFMVNALEISMEFSTRKSINNPTNSNNEAGQNHKLFSVMCFYFYQVEFLHYDTDFETFHNNIPVLFITVKYPWNAAIGLRPIVVADGLAPNRRQAIINHHVDSIMTIVSNNDIRQHEEPIIKLCFREVGRSITPRFLCN